MELLGPNSRGHLEGILSPGPPLSDHSIKLEKRGEEEKKKNQQNTTCLLPDSFEERRQSSAHQDTLIVIRPEDRTEVTCAGEQPAKRGHSRNWEGLQTAMGTLCNHSALQSSCRYSLSKRACACVGGGRGWWLEALK